MWSDFNLLIFLASFSSLFLSDYFWLLYSSFGGYGDDGHDAILSNYYVGGGISSSKGSGGYPSGRFINVAKPNWVNTVIFSYNSKDIYKILYKKSVLLSTKLAKRLF